MNFDITIYSDGGCDDNGFKTSVGGWGAVIITPHVKPIFIRGGAKPATNQQMELTAAIKALEFVAELPGSIVLHSDSKYLIDCINKKWFVNWRKYGWISATSKQPVKNRELWEALLDLIEARKKLVLFKKVRAHSGQKWNDKADELATEGKREMRRSTGNALSTIVGRGASVSIEQI